MEVVKSEKNYKKNSCYSGPMCSSLLVDEMGGGSLRCCYTNLTSTVKAWYLSGFFTLETLNWWSHFSQQEDSRRHEARLPLPPLPGQVRPQDGRRRARGQDASAAGIAGQVRQVPEGRLPGPLLPQGSSVCLFSAVVWTISRTVVAGWVFGPIPSRACLEQAACLFLLIPCILLHLKLHS